jgi:sulfhydrogenase subunit gamma (sulfur reductase)
MAIPVSESIYVPAPAKIVKITSITPMEKLFTIEMQAGDSLGHRPGQFVQVSLLGTGEIPISISSSPSRSNGTFEVCVRKVGDVTSAIHALEENALVGIRGPLGTGYPLENFKGKDILVTAGGLGIAPARSVINQILDERSMYGRFIILYGAKTPGELLFKEELQTLSQRDDVEFHVTVDRGDADWKGNIGVVTRLFPKIAVDPRNTVAITIGPPVMYRFVLMELLSKGIPESEIWLSLERRMKCGVGKCGHCQMDQLYCCVHGPSFTYAQIKGVEEALQ